MLNKVCLLFGTAFFAVLSISTSAFAETVEIRGSIANIFERRIDIGVGITPQDLYDPSTGPFDVGDSFLITLDLSTASGPTPFADGQSYDVSFTASFGDYEISDALGMITIVNDRSEGDFLFFSTRADLIDQPLGGGAVAGLPFSNINFSFQDDGADAFADDDLTLDKFDLNNFDDVFGSLVFTLGVNDNTLLNLTVTMNTESVSVFDGTEIPLPAALPLFLAGIGGLGAFARRRKPQI